ncbi:hypothetical protein ACWEQL_23390 [Kitasatospora sp. NPDC004240]
MTWMPDRGGDQRGRRHNSSRLDSSLRNASLQNGVRPGGTLQSGVPRSGPRPDRVEDLGHEGADHGERPDRSQLGIPRILGRRARWVGARLRREG